MKFDLNVLVPGLQQLIRDGKSQGVLNCYRFAYRSAQSGCKHKKKGK